MGAIGEMSQLLAHHKQCEHLSIVCSNLYDSDYSNANVTFLGHVALH